MNIGFLNFDLNPPFRFSASGSIEILQDLARQTGQFSQFFILQDLRLSVEMQSDCAFEEIHEYHTKMWVFGNVSQTCHDPVSTIFGIHQILLIKDSHKAWKSGPAGTVTVPFGIRGSDEHDLLFLNEFPHSLV